MRYVFAFIALLFGACAAQAEVPGSFADLAQNLSPAVVNISTTMQQPKKDDGAEAMQQPFQNLPPGHPLEEFNELFKQFQMPESMGPDATSLGSGFIIDPAGFIVTNNHVIADADEITVSLDDNTQYKAKVVGKDLKTDLAVLKIEAPKPLPYVTFGDSDKIRVGDWILAVGNPYGLGGTVTAGIISARARDINAGLFDDFLQTDAAINRGNSGGPMFNMDGKVVGINTAIFSPNGGSIGIGFAVPAALAEPIIQKLKSGQKIERGWLGVKIQSVTDEIAESLGMKKAMGALVVGVTPGSPAEKAKVQSGDVIVKFNGSEIDTMRKLPRVVAETKIGEEVALEVWRGGAVKKLEAEVGKLDEAEEKKILEGGMPGKKPARGEELLGLTLAPITDALKAEYGISGVDKGILVLEVEQGSEAEKKGIEPGDVITEVSQKPVRTVADIKSALKHTGEMKRKSILLYVMRDGDSLFVALPLE